MSHPVKLRRCKQTGLILLPVVITALLLALMAMALNMQVSGSSRRLADNAASWQSDYLLEAGVAHGKRTLQTSACTAYAVADKVYADGSYAVSYVPDSGSPVTMRVAATGADGLTRSRSMADLPAYEATVHELVLQPDAAEGKDTELDEKNPDQNYGTDNKMLARAKTGETKRGLLAFDLSAIPAGAHINSAELSIIAEHGHGTLQAYPMLRDWEEGTCDGKAGCAGSGGADWNTYDGSNTWTTPGGDYDANNLITSSNPGGDVELFDLLALVDAWHTGGRQNYGLMIENRDDHEATIKPADHSNAALHPTLTIRFQCECGVDCNPAPPPPVYCDANFTPNSEIRRLDGSAAGLSALISSEYLPPGAIYNGYTAPDEGGLLLADYMAVRIYQASLAGEIKDSHIGTGSSARGLAWISNGSMANHLAVVDRSNTRVNLLAADTALASFFSTSAYSRGPAGIAYIEDASSDELDGLLAIASDTNASSNPEAMIHLVTSSGALQRSIDLSAFVNDLNGVAHLPGTDNFLVSDRQGWFHVVDADGNALQSYADDAFGLSMPAETAINTQTCDHLLTDYGTQTLYTVNNINTDPIAWWAFDEASGTRATDSARDHDGDITLANWATGEGIGAASLQFSAEGARVEAAHASDLVLDESFSLAMWINTAAGANGVLISKGAAGSSMNFLMLFEGNRIALQYAVAGTLEETRLNFPANLDAGRWYHLLVSFDNTTGSAGLWLDGSQVDTASIAGNTTSNTEPVIIGASDLTGDTWEGHLDEVMIYDFALDDAQAQQLYLDAGTPVSGGSGPVSMESSKETAFSSESLSESKVVDCTYADDFESGDYAGSTGTLSWGSDWIEVNESDGPSRGDETISSVGGSAWLVVKDNDGGGEGVRRTLNLSGAGSASLSFRYQRDGLDGSSDYVSVLAGDELETELAQIAGPGTDSSDQKMTLDLSDWAGKTIDIGFISSSKLGGRDRVLFDDVTVTLDACP